jgi:phage/plasmid-like protein (TIGR03299 family)
MARQKKVVGRGTSPYAPENLLPEGMSLEEKIVKAGLNFELQEAVAMMLGPDGKYRAVPSRKVIYRSDTMDPLSIVSDDYKMVQPSTIANIHESVFAAGGFVLKAAGAIMNGARIWSIADTGEEIELPGGDRVRGSMFLATSCDGYMATTGFFTTLRMLCWNMLQRAMNDADKKGAFIKIPHTKVLDGVLLERLQQDLNRSAIEWKGFASNAKALARRPVTEEEAVLYFLTIQDKLDYTESEMTLEQQLQRHNDNQTMRRMMRLFQGAGQGSTVKSANGTAWGLLNAVTEFVDYYRVSADSGYRFNNAQLGSGYDLKGVALQEAVKLLG